VSTGKRQAEYARIYILGITCSKNNSRVIFGNNETKPTKNISLTLVAI